MQPNLRPFGLKWRRLMEWLRDVDAERPGPSEMAHMAVMSARAAFAPVPPEIYRQRLLICQRCPIYNAKRKSCRRGSDGCGCYVPYKALAPVECWLRETQGGTAGWGKPVRNPGDWDNMDPSAEVVS